MDKNIFETNGDKLIKYCGRGVNCSDPLCIPDGIRVIGKDSFSGMNSLKTYIRIPVGVEIIEEGLCSIGRTKSGCAETDKSKLNKKRVIELPEKVAAKRFKTE